MPRDFDIRDEIDALLKQLEATMDTPYQDQPEESPHDPADTTDRKPPMPAPKPEAEDTYMESPTMVVYIFDATQPPPASPFAHWDAVPPQTDMPRNGPWEADVVESTLDAEVTEVPATDEEDAIPVDVPPPPFEEDTFSHPRRVRRRTVGVLAALACVTLVALLIIVFYVVPLLTASVSITLIPVQTPESASSTLSVVLTGTGRSLAAGQVPGRLLSTLTVSGERTVATTGMGHADAQAAHGTLTFYNAALYNQTIPAGTVLTGRDGVEVVTDSDAVIPAASYPTFGQMTIPAHAVQVGPSGNIAAGDVYGPCCRVNVSAISSAFVGGQNARSYPMVTHSDITNAVNTLTGSLTGSVQAALGTQVHADETLITPVPCTSQIHSSASVGEEATQVTVQVSETCSGETYTTQAVQTVMTQQVTQVAQTRLGTGYTREGAIEVTVQHVQVQTGPHGGLILQVTGMGVWAYQFTDAQLATLATRLVGMSRQQATAVLLTTPGVSQVAIPATIDTLPADASHIHVLVWYQP